jgi:hypothetical protein
MWYDFMISWQPCDTIELAFLLYKEKLISRSDFLLFLLSYLK